MKKLASFHPPKHAADPWFVEVAQHLGYHPSIVLEAFLSFLGLGVQAPLSSWGLLIRDGAVSMEEYWWLLIFPSLAFSLTLFSLNFIGDGLRDALDPRTADS